MKVLEEQIETRKPSERQRPKVIKWKGIPMVRNHSFLATVDEIIEFSNELDLVKVGIIGDQHSGKSTLAEAIAHAIHKRHKLPFAVKIFKRENLLKFEETIKGLKPTNYILVFDDVSFLGANATKNQIEKVKKEITEIRHLDENTDVKIITIMNYHYTLGLDKYLRTADFKYFTTVNSEEEGNMEKIVGRKKMPYVAKFQQMRGQGITKKFFSMRIGPKEVFSYKWRNPFIPVLFFTPQKSLRLVVTPKREFLDEICSDCAMALGQTKSTISIDEFCKKGESNFGERGFLAAVKLKLYTEGKLTYGKTVVNAFKWLTRAQAQRIISTEDLAVHYGLTVTKTRLRKKLPFNPVSHPPQHPSQASSGAVIS